MGSILQKISLTSALSWGSADVLLKKQRQWLMYKEEGKKLKYEKKSSDGQSYYVYGYTEAERALALQVSLTRLASAMGYTPFRIGAYYSLKEMDSMRIYNDHTWYRNSQKGNRTGGTQIDFVLEYGEAKTVPEAINYLIEFDGHQVEEMKTFSEPVSPEEKISKEKKDFKLPPVNHDFKRLYAYLIKTRMISSATVSEFVKKKLIYEDAQHHNIVFCGRDKDGKIKYAGLRGTSDIYGKVFKMDVPGSDKNYGLNMVNEESSKLVVFEAAIDCMSYIDLYGDWSSNKLCLGMVADNPLEQFLQDHPHIKTIQFCLDNDIAGQKAIFGDKSHNRIGLKEKYEKMGYEVIVKKPPFGKDYNESLKEYRKNKAECLRMNNNRIR